MAKIEIRIPDWLDKICAWPVMWYRRRKFGYDFRRIYLGEGEWTILDEKDYYRFSGYKWYLIGDDFNFYAVCEIKEGKKRTRTIRMHREIMNAPKGLLVDHRNNNTLDNRSDNLRLATHSQNRINSRIDKSKTSSRFVGASLQKGRGIWISYINHNKKRIYLGRFKTEVEAARAYDRAAIKYHGEFARLNFPRENYINEASPSK